MFHFEFRAVSSKVEELKQVSGDVDSTEGRVSTEGMIRLAFSFYSETSSLNNEVSKTSAVVKKHYELLFCKQLASCSFINAF